MANRFGRFWAKGKMLIDGMRAMQQRGVFALLRRYAIPVGVIGLMLFLAYLVLRSVEWRSMVFGFVQKNPVLVVVPLTISLVVWFLWKYRRLVAAIPEVKDRVDMELKAWQTAMQFAGGTALLLGLYFTHQTLMTSQETLRTTQEGQITERFTKAIEQLGRDNNLSLRLGGIYALERIARDSAKDYWPVMEVLTAYVRERAPVQEKLLDNTAKEVCKTVETLKFLGLHGKLSADIQAILDVLSRRTRLYRGFLRIPYSNGEIYYFEDGSLDLRNTHLPKARLENTQLQGAILAGANLQDAYLVSAKLQKAILEGAHLQRADLRGAQLYGADLISARLQNACLQSADLRYAFLMSAYLERADLTSADFQGATLLHTRLQGTDLRGTKNLTKEQVQMACIDEHTQLPQYLTPPVTPPTPCPVPPLQ